MADSIDVTVTVEEVMRLAHSAPRHSSMPSWEWAHWRVREKLIEAGIPLRASFLPDKLRVTSGRLEWFFDALDEVYRYRWIAPQEAA